MTAIGKFSDMSHWVERGWQDEENEKDEKDEH